MFPLEKRQPIHYGFGERTSYSAHHLGQDYKGDYGTPVYAPFDGRVTTITGTEGGNTIWFYYKNYIMRGLHLSRFGNTGDVKEGDIVGYVGSTGSLSTGPHLHWDISKDSVQIKNFSNFINPEEFDWGKEYMGIDENQVRKLLESFDRAARQAVLGKVDEAGVKKDVDFRWSQIAGGSQTAFAEQFSDIWNARSKDQAQQKLEQAKQLAEQITKL